MTDKKLSVLAGLFAIRCNPAMQTGTFVYDSVGVDGGPYKINWLKAEEILREMANGQTELNISEQATVENNTVSAEWIISSNHSDKGDIHLCECSNCCFDSVKSVFVDGKVEYKPNPTSYCSECGARMYFSTNALESEE